MQYKVYYNVVMVININQRVEVQLTQEGANYINEYHKKEIEDIKDILEKMHVSEAQIYNIYPTDNERGDKIVCPLWELISKFGGYFKGKQDIPFIGNNINVLISEA